MVNWFIIILIIAVIFILFRINRLKHSRHKLVLLIIIFVLAFFVSSLYFVAKANNVDMTTLRGLSTGMQVYAGWLLNSFQNIKALTGYAIGLDWSPLNKSISFNKTNDNASKTLNARDVKVKIMDDATNTLGKVKANTPRLITSYK